MTNSRIYDHFVEQAGWNEGLGSPFTAGLLRLMGEDLLGDGPIAKLCADWPGNPRKDALGLRVLGAIHHGVLTGGSPGVAKVFPSGTDGGDPIAVWPIAREWLNANIDHVRDFMKSPPQTNETRRSIAMLPAFLELATKYDMPMHLLELGASAGLNQNWDRFNYAAETWAREGDSDVTISTDWVGVVPGHLDTEIKIASRAACDLNPLDISDPAQALRLKSYTWPDQAERLSRLDAAIALARETNVQVEQADAVEWLERKLANRPKTGLTVVFHSVFLIYPPKEDIARIMELIAAAGAAATPEAPLAWVCYESEALFGGTKDSPIMQARLQDWPGGTARVLANSNGHVTRIEAVKP